MVDRDVLCDKCFIDMQGPVLRVCSLCVWEEGICKLALGNEMARRKDGGKVGLMCIIREEYEERESRGMRNPIMLTGGWP